jgi:prepilin peptidase CpaA
VDIVFAFVLSVAAVYDLREQRIPNALTVGGLVSALTLRLLLDPALVVPGLLGAAGGLVIALVIFAMGAFGAGDGKLIVAVGAFLGPEGLLAAMVATVIVGGLIAVYVSLRTGVFLPVLLETKDLVLWCLTLGRAGARRTLAKATRLTLPYGPAIAIGAAVAWGMRLEALP